MAAMLIDARFGDLCFRYRIDEEDQLYLRTRTAGIPSTTPTRKLSRCAMGADANVPASGNIGTAKPPTASSVVARIAWTGRHLQTYCSAALLRDFFLTTPIPSPSTQVSVPLLNSSVELEIVAVNPQHELRASLKTRVFLLPPLSTSLTLSTQQLLLPFEDILSLLSLTLLDEGPSETLRLLSVSPPRVLLVHTPFDSCRRIPATIAHVASLVDATLINLQATDILRHATTPNALYQTLLHYIQAARECESAIVHISNAHFVFPPWNNRAAAAISAAIAALHELVNEHISNHSTSKLAIVISCAPNTEALHKSVAPLADAVIQLSQTEHPTLIRAPLSKTTVSAHLGGLAHSRAVLLRLLNPLPNRPSNIPAPHGILLYGPPGTGKTALVRYASLQSQYQILALDAATLARGHVSASEKRLIAAFDEAKRQTPCVIFLDEIDALFAGGRSGVQARLVTVLSRLLDNLCDGLVTVAATNRPWRVSSALLTAGRLDFAVHVSLPSAHDRSEIASVYGRKMNLREDVRASFAHIVSGDTGEGLSGADIAGVCRSAAMQALCANEEIGLCHLRYALERVVPTVSPEHVEKISQWSSAGTSVED